MFQSKHVIYLGISVLIGTALLFLGCDELVPLSVDAPSVPQNFAATAGQGQAVLTWTVSSETTVTSYKIRQTVDNETTDISVNGRQSAKYIVKGLTGGKTYTFTIAAVAGGTESVESEAVTVTPTVALIAPVLKAAAGVEQVKLSWDSVSGATSYKVYQNGSPLVNVNGTSHTVTGLKAGVSYLFTVSAENSDGEGAWSNPVTAAPTAAEAAPAAAPQGTYCSSRRRAGNTELGCCE